MDELTPGDIEDFKKDLRRSGTGTRTINLTVGAIRTAINEGLHRGDIKNDPTVGVHSIKSDEEERGIFSIEEIRKMFSFPGGLRLWGYDTGYHGSPSGEKVLPIIPYTLALLMFATGERPSAILRLNWEDVDSDMITFRVTKAAGARSIPIVTMATKALRELSDSMLHVAPADPVFCHDDTGQRLTYAFFPKRFAHMMATLDLPTNDADGRKRTPYSLKSSLITHLIDGGADPILVREYVGHSHGTGEKRLTKVQSRYKKAQRERLKILLPDIEVLLSAESVVITES
ncbi:tyrosine-type recombinase/integrase [Sediminispirochaeta smaragdinae]|nr:tyrosine-type recombinase/integrase [Sediminispirochaeta smaragdinae]